MQDYDPLHPAAYESPRAHAGQATHQPHPDSALSSVAPRSPLPGYDRNYRAPGSSAAPQGSAWGASAGDGWGGAGAGAGTSAGQGSQRAQGGMVPRDPRTVEGARREGGAGAAGGAGASGTEPGQGREGFIRVRILGLERNRRDLYVKFNVETNLPNFQHSTYRAISRSYTEFTALVSALSVTCPQSIVPALPISQTSAASDEEDDRLIKAAFQKWVIRLTSDPAIIRDDETRSFIESDFGYTARARKKSSAPSLFSRASRLPGELDDPLTAAKISMARLETAFAETSKTLDSVSKKRREAAKSVSELGDQLATFAMAETYAPLAGGFKRLARTMKVDADLLAAQSTNEQVSLGDVFFYHSANAKAAKDTLSGRDAVVDEHRRAVKASIAKRREIEKLRSSSSLKADRVNEALEELDEAQRYEETLGRRLQGISTNLQPSLTRHSLDTHNDLLSALLEHARHALLYEKQRLKEYEVLRPDMRAIRRPDAGVIYHTTPAGAPMARSASASSSIAGRAAPASPTPSRTFAASPLAAGTPALGSAAAGGGDPLSRAMAGPDLGSMAQKTQKRTVRSMASSVQVEGDRRQRVDARMAASLLANGF
ncbi:Vacuolar protein sorting-associated protein 17 [Rhodotorula kratochvilovae]